MADALVLPIEKLDRRGLAELAARVVSLRELLGRVPQMGEVTDAVTAGLGEALGLGAVPGQLCSGEEALAARMLADEFGRDAFVAGDDEWRGGVAGVAATTVMPGAATAPRTLLAEAQFGGGGRISAHIRVRDGETPTIERVWLVGDVLVTPPRALLDLEAALCGMPLRQAETAARDFLMQRGVEILGSDAAGLAGLIGTAAALGQAKADPQVNRPPPAKGIQQPRDIA